MRIRVPFFHSGEIQRSGDRGPAGGCLLALLILGLVAGGCGGPGQTPAAPPVQEVEVGLPVTREVVDSVEYTGRTEAKRTIDVRARVSGYLEKVMFREGYDVKEGDVLFLIDPRTYQADYDRAVANLAQAKAHLTRLEADFHRAENLIKTAAISKSEYDLALGDRNEATAMVGVAEAAVNSSRLNLNFTKVLSPISGRVSRQNIDPGNMVVADSTILTTVVSMDPIYAYFDVDESSMLRFRRLMEAGKVKSARDATSPLFMGLADEDGRYPHEGTINFVDNRLDPSTGTLRLRGVFDNHNQFFSPGMFVRIRVPMGPAHPAILATERAIGSDQDKKFLYVLNDKNEVVYREVQIGAFQAGLRVIESGLAPGERFVVNGLQRIKPGDTVEPQLLPASSPGDAQPKGKAAVLIRDGKGPAVVADESPRPAGQHRDKEKLP